MEVSEQIHAPAALAPGKEPPVPLDRRLGGPQSQSGCGEEGREIPDPVGNRTPVIQPVAKSLY